MTAFSVSAPHAYALPQVLSPGRLLAVTNSKDKTPNAAATKSSGITCWEQAPTPNHNVFRTDCHHTKAGQPVLRKRYLCFLPWRRQGP